MNYNDALNYIHSFLKFGSKPGLERVKALLEKLGNPQNSLRIVHVAGTNGKGSTSVMLSEIFKLAGLRTGLFTSPYVVDFCERIQIDGKMIPHDELAELSEKIKVLVDELNREGIEPTEFEIITAMAFDYFSKEKCDIVVLEVGLGGLYDSTNVIFSPLASVITSISYDHTAVLGNTIEEIAYQKCGIIKDNSSTVSYPLQEKSVFGIIKSTAEEKNNPCIIPDLNKLKIKNSDIFSSEFEYKGVEYKVNLSGEHQIYNALTVIETAKNLGFDEIHIVNGIKRASLPARVEFLRKNPPVILDGGHNEDGTRAFSKVLEKFEENIVVVGMMADKDVEKSVENLSRNAKIMIATEASNPRSMKADELKKICERYCDNVLPFENSFEAVDKAFSLQKNNLIAFCGSLYLAGDIRKYIIEKIGVDSDEKLL